jgi:hypothetical protein
MNQLGKISLLSFVVLCIISFWLAPGINKGQETRYVRYYEDTDVAPEHKTISALTPDTVVKNDKVYKKEEIKTVDDPKVTVEMFSRASHFEPLLVDEDSLLILEETDSLLVIQ